MGENGQTAGSRSILTPPETGHDNYSRKEKKNTTVWSIFRFEYNQHVSLETPMWEKNIQIQTAVVTKLLFSISNSRMNLTV